MTPSKAARLRALLTSPDLSFLMEAHNGLSARIAEEAGFQGLWGSGLTLSASMGVRDNNELSWTQVLDIIDFVNDATTLPLLLDGDTGYGNFNNMRRLVKKLESQGTAGVCIEDKLFPKTNSFINGESQQLADIDEFCGKIKAGKDAQENPDFSIVARVEALIAGCGLPEAMRRAEAYHAAGADAILMHSKSSRPDEILAFKREWGNRLPVVIVPTTYYGTPTEVFQHAGISVVIWANHLLRSAITAMRQTAEELATHRSGVKVEDRIAGVTEIFRLQGTKELEEAEKRYLPERPTLSAVVLAASRGDSLDSLTEDRPKAMIPVGGRPLVEHTLETLRGAGVGEITIVRGYKKAAIDLPGVSFVDNDEFEVTQDVYSLAAGIARTTGPVLVSYGDIIYHKYIALNLVESDADFCLAVDADWAHSRNIGRYGDLVICTHAYDKRNFSRVIHLARAHGRQVPDGADGYHGEWMGLFKMSAAGVASLKAFLASQPAATLRQMRMTDVFNGLIDAGQQIRVVYTRGDWIDVDEIKDVLDASGFGGVA